jgi:hypothetical protein
MEGRGTQESNPNEGGLEALKRILNSDFPQIVVSPENLNNLIDQVQAGVRPTRKFLDIANSRVVIPLTDIRLGEGDRPTNEIEAAIAKIWMDVFGHEQIGTTSSSPPGRPFSARDANRRES